LVLTDENNNTVFFGDFNEGKRIGKYHTWCSVEIEGANYIIDILGHFKPIFFEMHQKSLDSSIPDYVVASTTDNNSYKYIENIEYESQSKNALNTKTDPRLVEILIKVVEETSKIK
jgi:hypothetical protein